MDSTSCSSCSMRAWKDATMSFFSCVSSLTSRSLSSFSSRRLVSSFAFSPTSLAMPSSFRRTRSAVSFMCMSMSSCRSRICRFCFLIISLSSEISAMSWLFSCFRSLALRKVSATPLGPSSSSYFFCSFSNKLIKRLYLTSQESWMYSISFFRATTVRSRARMDIMRSRSLSSQHCRAFSNCCRVPASSASTSAFARSTRAASTRRSNVRLSQRLRRAS
mmetsp:Transcript_95339/g.296852  ORF Transcript_95339/g.296852 Transcript_95339/m.296852 type:complete len:219 (-) Transcript_95339:200-856(-)